MSLTSDLQKQLERDEGNVPYVYPDSRGYSTIGIGFMVDERKGGKLYPEEITFILLNRITRLRAAISGALPWTDKLSEPRLGVLLNMAYQMGTTGLFQFQNTLAAIRDGHYDHAANEMLQSDWAHQTPDRAKRLSRQMASDAWQ